MLRFEFKGLAIKSPFVAGVLIGLMLSAVAWQELRVRTELTQRLEDCEGELGKAQPLRIEAVRVP